MKNSSGSILTVDICLHICMIFSNEHELENAVLCQNIAGEQNLYLIVIGLQYVMLVQQ